ncbi:MAG: hypothetical protein WEB87_05640, partial [Bacteriovoracaceae bacterium]
MLYDGKAIQVDIEQGIVHFVFNIKDASANVIGNLMMAELPQALEAVRKENSAKGLLFRSEKDHFIFGADITEFMGHFSKSDEQL